MLSIWRGFVWTVGALSIAVLLRGAFDASLAPAMQSALDAYDAALSSGLTRLEPFVALLLPWLKATLGAGTALYPHWTHVFVVALLHMLPRVDATFGVGWLTAGALWCGQAFLALVVALVSAAYVGAAPFVAPVSEEGMFVGVFIASAFLISAYANFTDRDESVNGEEQPEAVDPWPTRYWLARGFTFAFFLAMIGAIAIGLMSGWLDRESGERAFIILVLANIAVFILFVVAQLIYFIFLVPRDNDDDIFWSNGPLTAIALVAMLLATLVISDALSPQFVVSPTAYAIFLFGLIVLGAYALGRVVIGRFVGRDDDAYVPHATPALGMFLVGGATIAVVSHLAS